MTDLILIIIIIGIIFVASVYGYNILQERKFKKEGDDRFGSLTKDALLDEDAKDFNIDADSAIIEDDANFHVSSMNVEVQEHMDSGIMESFKAELYAKPQASEIHVEVLPELNELESTSSLATQALNLPELTKLAATGMPAKMTEAPLADDDLSDDALNYLANEKIAVANKPQKSPEYFSQHIDYIVNINFIYQISGAKLKSQFAKFGRIKNNYKIYIATPNGSWQTFETLHLEAPYIAACVGLQIADRAGAVRSEVIEYFADLSAEIGDQIGAEVTIEPALDVIERADHLDKFCMAVDQLVSFNLFEGVGAFSGTKLRGLLEANGFELNANGLFTYKNELGDVLFSVQAIDGQPFNALMLKTVNITGIKFLLDLPHVKSGVATFNQMVLVAKQMEASLQARLLDEQKKPITEIHIDKIRNQIKTLQEKMVVSQVIPGSALAKRLFV